MGKIAFLFAGQGAQAPGMGKSLYEAGGAARQVFDAVEKQRPGTLADCFEADAARLAQTAVTQPCVYAVALAAGLALAQLGVKPMAAAGFSLGEMAALTFAGVFGPANGAMAVCRRGELMEQAARENPGAMVAVLRLADEQVEALCAQFGNLWPVNYNCPGQLVVAGAREQIPEFCAQVKAAGGVARPLAVSGAFHTPYMEEAARRFAALLDGMELRAPAIPVYANLNAAPYAQPLGATLAAQMHSPVRWAASISAMKETGIDTYVELGPGKTLSGLVRRIDPEAAVYNVEDAQGLQAVAAQLACE